MEEKRIRRTFDKDFKISAVKMVLEGKQSLSSVSRDLGIADNTLQNWKNKYLKEITPTEEKTTVDLAEYKRVLKENAMLKEQCAILKKAAVYFSQHDK